MRNQEKKQRGQRANKTDGRVKGEYYFYIDSCGDIDKIHDAFDYIDNHRYKTGNYFKTEEEAEEYIEKIKIYMKLKRLSERLNNGKKIDWNDRDQYKYYILYNYYSDCIDVDDTYIYQKQGTIYCLNEDFKDIAIKEIGEERLLKLFKDQQEGE